MIKIGVVGIVLKADRQKVAKVQSLLSDYSEIIVGRMGIPDKETGINTISLIVNGDTEKISALCGKLVQNGIVPCHERKENDERIRHLNYLFVNYLAVYWTLS